MCRFIDLSPLRRISLTAKVHTHNSRPPRTARRCGPTRGRPRGRSPRTQHPPHPDPQRSQASTGVAARPPALPSAGFGPGSHPARLRAAAHAGHRPPSKAPPGGGSSATARIPGTGRHLTCLPSAAIARRRQRPWRRKPALPGPRFRPREPSLPPSPWQALARERRVPPRRFPGPRPALL